MIKRDQKMAVTWHVFRQIDSAYAIDLDFTLITEHNATGQVDSTYGPLRRIYLILMDKYAALSDNLGSRFAVKSLNETDRSKGLVPWLLVFGTIPSLWNTGVTLTDQDERFKAMYTARSKASKLIAEKQIWTGLKINVPPSAKYQLISDQKPMAKRKTKKVD